MPAANTLTVSIFALLAQYERETSPKRTKDALAAKKARGAQFDTPANLTAAARKQSPLVRRAHIQQHPGLRQTAALYCLLPGTWGELSPAGGEVERAQLYGSARENL